MLELESPAFTRKHYPESDKPPGEEATLAAAATPDSTFNPNKYFASWLDDVQAAASQLAREPESQEIYLQSGRATKGELTFDGVLHFDGYTVGDIRSQDGTLVLEKEGRVEADIYVRKAIISGFVTGNINAPEGVILDSSARVTGEIYTRILSIRVGALLEGDCVFWGADNSGAREVSGGVEWLDKRRA